MQGKMDGGAPPESSLSFSSHQLHSISPAKYIRRRIFCETPFFHPGESGIGWVGCKGLLQRGESFSSAPLIRELIIGMVGFLLMKHNLLSATHHPTLHQALSCHCTLYVLSSVISGISAYIDPATLSQVFDTVDWCYSPRYLCGCAHNDTAELCYYNKNYLACTEDKYSVCL